MKYLIITKKTAPLGVTPSQTSALYLEADKWQEEKIAAGIIEASYTFIEGGGMSIIVADSHDEVMNIVRSYPLYPYREYEVKPLCTLKHGFALNRTALDRVAARREA